MLLPAGIPRCRVLHTYTTLHLHTHITLHLPTVLSHSLSFLFSFALTLLTPALPLSPLWHTPPRPFPTHAIHLPLRLHCSTLPLSLGPSLSLLSVSLSSLTRPCAPPHTWMRPSMPTLGCLHLPHLYCWIRAGSLGLAPIVSAVFCRLDPGEVEPACWTAPLCAAPAGNEDIVCVCVCVCVEGAFGRTLENGPR